MTLQGRFNLFIFLGIFIFILSISLVYLEITTFNHHLLDLEMIERLYENVLEIRRYEKNFLLYHDSDSVDSIRSYVQQARTLISKAPAEMRDAVAAAQVERIGAGLEVYSSLAELSRLHPATKLDARTLKRLRNTGQQIVEDTERLMRSQRRQVAVAANNALRWPLITMAAMILLFMAVARMTILKVVRPLAMIEEATGKVARGDYSPIPYYASKTKVDHLVEAFNRMAQELEAREEQIIHSRKIASLGTLVSGVAHELNNPINNIVLTADTLNSRRKKLTTEHCAAMMRDVLAQALRASEIVKNLLEFSRAQSAGHEELDLAALLRESLQISENHLTLSNVTLHDEIENDLPHIVGSRQGLQQVFLNLITNAAHALERGGDLTVRARRETDDRILIEFEDTGTGIPEEDLPRIFDPFFTTKEVGKGTGLGLSVSFGIIKKHGGQISVKSRIGLGTTFTIILPALKDVDLGTEV
jgi:two-component system NtrC family sensor kinase